MFHVDYLIKPCNYPITDDWKSELAHAHTADERQRKHVKPGSQIPGPVLGLISDKIQLYSNC